MAKIIFCDALTDTLAQSERLEQLKLSVTMQFIPMEALDAATLSNADALVLMPTQESALRSKAFQNAARLACARMNSEGGRFFRCYLFPQLACGWSAIQHDLDDARDNPVQQLGDVVHLAPFESFEALVNELALFVHTLRDAKRSAAFQRIAAAFKVCVGQLAAVVMAVTGLIGFAYAALIGNIVALPAALKAVRATFQADGQTVVTDLSVPTTTYQLPAKSEDGLVHLDIVYDPADPSLIANQQLLDNAVGSRTWLLILIAVVALFTLRSWRRNRKA